VGTNKQNKKLLVITKWFCRRLKRFRLFLSLRLHNRLFLNVADMIILFFPEKIVFSCRKIARKLTQMPSDWPTTAFLQSFELIQGKYSVRPVFFKLRP
jgi:hypothetical protein